MHKWINAYRQLSVKENALDEADLAGRIEAKIQQKTLDILKTQDCEPSLITQQRALERSGLSAAPAARAAPSIDEESPPQDINRTPEQCSTGFEWSNKFSTPVDSEIEAWSASSPPCSASEDNVFAQFEPSTSVSSLIKEATERLLHTHETNTEWKS